MTQSFFTSMESKLVYSLLLLLQFTICNSTNTIAINQTFRDGNLLLSEGNNFALGFFSPTGSSFQYLGIWFHKVPQTVVWVANRNNPIRQSSGFLSIDPISGNLVLYSNNKNPIWSTNVSINAADTREAKLLDSGNLVLFGENSETVWQSFEHPTDTMLPGMKLGINRKTGANMFLSSGNYSFSLEPNGSPQFFLRNRNKRYWRTSPWPWTKDISGVYTCDFTNNKLEITYNCSFYDPSVTARLVLDDSGILKWLIWHEIDGIWKQFSSYSLDHCDLYGRCGPFGKCDPDSAVIFGCNCLPGYEPKNPRDWNMRDGREGCVRKRRDSVSICGNGEGFVKVKNVKVPDSSIAVWIGMIMSRSDCELECKRNCSCLAYSSVVREGRSGCLAWYGELVDTMNFIADLGVDLYVRVDAIELDDEKLKNGTGEIPIILIISVALAWVVAVLIIFCWLKKRKKKSLGVRKRRMNNLENILSPTNEHELGSSSNFNLTLFNFSTILAATGNFSLANKIGQGGFGAVYKGQLSNGWEIAVKKMSKSSKQGTQQFKNEVQLIAKLQHKNLVKLLGWCSKRKEHILVYEYCPNKSLDSFLSDEKRSLMDWETRFNIIVGIARGILYLHQDSRLTIIHRALKCSNILLDAKMNPKISDFGMARTCDGDRIEGKTSIVAGTYGYMPPEYALLGKFSVKSDVFSFGVIVLEVVSGTKSSRFHQKDDPALNFISKVWELWSEGRAMETVDFLLNGSYDRDEALRCILVGLLCVQEDAADRPRMSKVITMLTTEMSLPCPKHPAFVLKTSSSNIKAGEEIIGSANELTMSSILAR